MNNTKIIKTIKELRELTNNTRKNNGKIAFVPTMGALHEGHLSLMRKGRQIAELLITSIFVNPKQFGPNEDLQKYPRTLEKDYEKCQDVGVDVVFTPSVEEMYSDNFQTEVSLTQLSKNLCGVFRPNHFAGVATVVLKLFNQVGPCTAIFGRKDYQQLKIIQKMVKDLDLEIQVIGMPIVREHDGLAMSSRNMYLNSEERNRSLCLVNGLCKAYDLYEFGERKTETIIKEVKNIIEPNTDKIDYITLVNSETLIPFEGTTINNGTLLALAVYIGKTRLIDNIVLGEDQRPFK